MYGPLEPCNSSAAVVEHHLLIQDVLGRRVQAPRGTCGCGLITLHLSNNMFEGSTGCHEWEAGFLMAEAVLNNPDLFRGG